MFHLVTLFIAILAEKYVIVNLNFQTSFFLVEIQTTYIRRSVERAGHAHFYIFSYRKHNGKSTRGRDGGRCEVILVRTCTTNNSLLMMAMAAVVSSLYHQSINE
jgi:hypothetical protein